MFFKTIEVEKIPNRIKKTRELKNWTQEYMAERLGISQNTYSRIETKASKISVDRLLEIAQILEVPIDFLMNTNSPILNISNNHNNKYIDYFEVIEEKDLEYLKERIVLMQDEIVRLRKENHDLLEIVKSLSSGVHFNGSSYNNNSTNNNSINDNSINDNSINVNSTDE